MPVLNAPPLEVAVAVTGVVTEALKGVVGALVTKDVVSDQTATGDSMSAMRPLSLRCPGGPERYKSRQAQSQNDVATT